MDAPIYTRKEAHALGLHKYWNGKPCQRGHSAMRFVSNGMCSACLSGHQSNYKPAMRGLVKLVFEVHPDDAPAVRDLVMALAAARGAQPVGHLIAATRRRVIELIPPGAIPEGPACLLCNDSGMEILGGCPGCRR